MLKASLLARVCAPLYLILTVGCASITTGQDQTFSVETPLCPAASCRMTNNDGTFFVATTPGTVSVNRSCSDMTIECTKPGADPYLMTVDSSVKAMAFGNILFGGFIGAGVDAWTGAACQYPALVPVPMDCRAGTTKATAQPVPEAVTEAVSGLECGNARFLSAAADGANFYLADCEENNIFLRCDDEGCAATEFSEG